MDTIKFKINGIVGHGILLSVPKTGDDVYEVRLTSDCGKFKAGKIVWVYPNEVLETTIDGITI